MQETATDSLKLEVAVFYMHICVIVEKTITFVIVMDLDKVKYWTETSDYDLETADAMFRTGRWLYVGYMCHQVIEKIFKAYWCSKKEEPAPYSHNLINIAQSCGLGQMLTEEQRSFVGEMMPLNIEARYPSYKQAIGESLSEDKCKDILVKTKVLQQWVKERL